MADNSNNNPSEPKNWRERIGVKEGNMPKLADEFRTEPRTNPAPQERRPQQQAPAPEQKFNTQRPTPETAQRPPLASRPAYSPRPAPAEGQPAAPLKPVSSPAPMAPRRPVTPAPSAPPRSQTTPAAPTRDAEYQPAAPEQQQSSSFGDRLRAQREAAEALAKQRAEETRNRLSGAVLGGSGPSFSFADEEIKAAEQEKSQVQRPVTPPTPTPRVAAPAPPRRPFRPEQGGFPKPYQPSDVYRQTHGYRDYGKPSPAPAPYEAPAAPTAYDASATDNQGERRQVERRQAEQEAYSPPQRPAPGYEYQPPEQTARAPQPSQSQQDAERYNDDFYDDPNGQGAGRPPAHRADASDYTAAYRDYDDAFEYEEEPSRRGGIWVFVVLMLIVIAAIAAGAYWFINYGTKIGSGKTGNGNVPTVTAPQDPVKVTPAPADTTTPGAPVRRKKIYDRILGDQTLEPEKLAPSEEKPVTPPKTPAPVTTPEAPTSNNSPVGVEPLPLPLPPPPTIPGVQGSVSPKTNQVAEASPASAKSGQTTIAPISAGAAKQNTAAIQAGGQQAPLALPLPGIDSQTTTASTTTSGQPDASQPPVSQPQTATAPPLPRTKPESVITRARQAAEQRRLAALTQSVVPSVPLVPRTALPGGSGPVQITPGTGSQNFNTAAPVAPLTQPTVPVSPPTQIANVPQPRQQAPVAQPQVTTGGGYVLQMSSFRNRDAASSEYRRLVSRHSSVLRGLSPEIQEADLGASGKFYKLRLGSVADRTQASRLCNALIAAGEKDCLVRSR